MTRRNCCCPFFQCISRKANVQERLHDRRQTSSSPLHVTRRLLNNHSKIRPCTCRSNAKMSSSSHGGKPLMHHRSKLLLSLSAKTGLRIPLAGTCITFATFISKLFADIVWRLLLAQSRLQQTCSSTLSGRLTSNCSRQYKNISVSDGYMDGFCYPSSPRKRVRYQRTRLY